MTSLARRIVNYAATLLSGLWIMVMAFCVCMVAGVVGKLMWYALTFGWRLLP